MSQQPEQFCNYPSAENMSSVERVEGYVRVGVAWLAIWSELAPILGILPPPPHIEPDRQHEGLEWQHPADALNYKDRFHGPVVQTRILSLQGHRFFQTRPSTLGPLKEAVEDRLSRLVNTHPRGLAGGHACESEPSAPLDQPLISHSDVRQSAVTVPGARGGVEIASDYHSIHVPGPAGRDLAC